MGRHNIMVRTFREIDLIAVMQIWLSTNLKAHDFIPSKYWTDHYDLVKDMLPQAEIYVHEDDVTKQIDGFIGLNDDYIEGIFVEETAQSKGIGKQLLDFAKSMKSGMSLRVYQKNTRAISFYQRERFLIQSEDMDDSTNEKEFMMTWRKK